MAILAIKGHATRGKEVIKILEMLGGGNPYAISTAVEGLLYRISNYDNRIVACSPKDTFVVFSLEEFLEKFPYKVGDKVYNIIHNENQTITEVAWDFQEDVVVYQTNNNEYLFVNYLQPYKEETMEEPKELIIGFTKDDNGDWVLNTHKDYEIKEIEGKYKVVKKKPQYPKDYKECCEVLSLDEDGRLYTKGYKASLIQDFQQLLICRDTYWKIAGEELGLDKSWKPDFTNDNEERYGIYTTANKVEKDFCGVGDVNVILTFPTEEMRDAFYENFKELINETKELL